MSAFERSFLLLACFAVVSCENTSTPPPKGICFTTEVMPLLDAGCAKSGCHEEDDFLSTPGLVEPSDPTNSRLIKVLTSTDPTIRMPPPQWPSFDSTDIHNISLWIEQGASRSVCTTPLDTANVTFTTRIKGIVDLYCIGCHKRQVSGSGPILTTYVRVVDEIRNGHFMQTVERQSGYVPMPPGRTTVSNRDLELIRIWVAHGMPE